VCACAGEVGAPEATGCEDGVAGENAVEDTVFHAQA